MKFLGYTLKFVRCTAFCIYVLLFLMILPSIFADQPFNVEVDLPKTYQESLPGQDIWLTIKLLNLANPDRIDVTLQYDIVDSQNTSLVTKSKTVAIETQASFVADLRLPQEIKPGQYSVLVKVSSSLGDSYAATPLKVIMHKSDLLIYYIVGGIILIGLAVLLYFRLQPTFEKNKLKHKVDKIVSSRIKKK